MDENTSSPLHKKVIFSEPPSTISFEPNTPTTTSSTAVKGNGQLKSRKTIQVGSSSCNHNNYYRRRGVSLDSYTYYHHHPISNIYDRNDNNYECFCHAYGPQSPQSLKPPLPFNKKTPIRPQSPRYPIYGYSTSSDDMLYPSSSTKLYPDSNMSIGSKEDDEKNKDSEILESGKDITKKFFFNIETWNETIYHKNN
ncbi:3614_t:CDS:1 [Cetraspora pellucida]|uniref:3614_t:CDS:1 n=1 Tax=Cetraspora pellucida TaxID=1433469 RepID=A0A9N8VAJ2_9GLOM|nr:3614_t:CDS:1 [Cetraspora pellucida]